MLFEHSSNVGTRDKQPAQKQDDGENREHPLNSARVEHTADSDTCGAKRHLGEDERPPLHGELRLARKYDTNYAESEEPETHEPEENTCRHANSLPHVADGDACDSQEALWENLVCDYAELDECVGSVCCVVKSVSAVVFPTNGGGGNAGNQPAGPTATSMPGRLGAAGSS